MYVFFTFFTFFQNPKKTWLFTFFFWVLHTFSPTVLGPASSRPDSVSAISWRVMGHPRHRRGCASGLIAFGVSLAVRCSAFDVACLRQVPARWVHFYWPAITQTHVSIVWSNRGLLSTLIGWKLERTCTTESLSVTEYHRSKKKTIPVSR